jgi:outer membrane protein TolC
MKPFLLPCGVLAAWLTVASETAAPPPLTVVTPALVSAYSETLRTNHPALRAARSRVTAATLEAQAVRRWDDPMATVGGSVFNSSWMTPQEQGDVTYGVEQKLPVMGKEKAMRQLADAEAAVTVEAADAQFQEMRRDLAKALFAAALAEETLRLGEEDLAWAGQAVTAAEARYTTGMGSQFEVLRLQSEWARRAAQLGNERSQVEARRSEVNRLLGREPLSPLANLSLPALAEPVAFSTNLLRFALSYEPRLKVQGRMRRSAEAATEVSRRAGRPDVSLGVDGLNYSGDGGFRQGMFTLRVSLPWFNRANYRRDQQRDRARLGAAIEDQSAMILDVQNEIHHLTVEIAAAHREAVALRDEVIPRAEQAFAAAHAGWSNGRGMLNDVLEARRMILDSRRMLARAITEEWSAMSELVLCCGLGDLEALEMLARKPAVSAEPVPTQP